MVAKCKHGIRIGILLLSFLFSLSSMAQKQSWSAFLKQLRVEAIAQGIRPQVFDAAFKSIKAPSHKVLHYDRTQPEKRLTFLKYRNTRADAYRIKLGRRELKKYHAILNEIGRKYGVSKCFIVSLWGLWVLFS